MKYRITYVALTLVVGLSLGLSGCNDSPVEPTSMVDSGSWYVTGFRWAHDGEPYESDNLVVYSDGASEEARRTLAEIGEELLAELKHEFGITDDIFTFPRGQSKIHIFTYKNQFPMQWGGWAYYGGLLIYSLDHRERGIAGHTSMDMYAPVVKHELMHVAESLIKASGNPSLVDVWLTEGIAEAVSGGTAGGAITDLSQFHQLMDEWGALNPVAMHVYDYPDIEGVAYHYYYPMFQLAAEYLFDETGHGSALSDFRDLLLDVRDGLDFATAFENRLGISLAEYERRFFDLMNNYLR